MRALAWAICSAAVAAVLGGAIVALTGLLRMGLRGQDLFVFWTSGSWWLACAGQLVVLVLSTLTRRPTIRRYLLGSLLGFTAFVLVGGALLLQPDAPTSAGVEAALEWGAAVSLLFVGNGWPALLAPLVLGLLPPFRAALLGAPPRWSNRAVRPEDEDAAVEDAAVQRAGTT